MDVDGLYVRGDAAYFAGLLSKAGALPRQAPEAGHLDATSRVGRLYDVAADEEQAIRWCRAAAERGDTYAMTYLATVIEDDGREAALDWPRRALAADAGLTARYNLGIFCEEDGHWEEAEDRYRRAAEVDFSRSPEPSGLLAQGDRTSGRGRGVVSPRLGRARPFVRRPRRRRV